MSTLFIIYVGLQDSSLGKRKSDATTSVNKKKAAKPVLTNERREERNAREKDRSLKITTQIHELRNLLSVGGVIVPKVGIVCWYYFVSIIPSNIVLTINLSIIIEKTGHQEHNSC